MGDWEYGGVYKKYDMDKEIHVGGGVLKVHNIFEPLPEFMSEADCIFCDPPCSKGNINSFYTKADRTDYQVDYTPFARRFFQCIDEIKPQKLFVELFKSNKEFFKKKRKKRYKYTEMYETTYYHNKKNKCYIIACSNEPIPDYPFQGMDEENVIEWICKNVQYECIGDLCMGQGLVGKHAFNNNKRFVGTELNKKRLAVLVDYITNSVC